MTSTLFAASLQWNRKTGNMLVLDPPIDMLPDGPAGPRRFKIKAADTESKRSLVSALLRSRYAWRGYKTSGLPSSVDSERFTLLAVEGDQTIGTISVAFDGPSGLASHDSFPEEIQTLRRQGFKICEFTKLAIDPTVGTKRVLAALFHVAYIIAHRLRRFDLLVIEVNPRHQRYYERMLGLRLAGSVRPNRSVQAPAVLLCAEFSQIMDQIGRYGGRPELAESERSLYPFAFSLTEEAGIIARIRLQHGQIPDTVISSADINQSNLP